MRYLVLNRHFKNFGDYLIFESAVNILKKEINNFTYDVFNGSEKIPDPMVENHDAFIICGGPCIQKNLYPNIYPLNPKIFQFNKPIYLLGVGSKVFPFLEEKYKLDNETKKFLRYCNNFSKVGCRDDYTVALLKDNYIEATMNGCPAWYNFDYFTKRIQNNLKINKILISVPGSELFFDQFISLLIYLKNLNRFEINVSFNHGITIEKYKRLYNKVKNLSVAIHDMSENTSNSKIYDEMDLHIGYRVHSNIYFLSHRKPSILIIEDSRGKGVIETLGGVGILGYKYPSRLKYFVNRVFNSFSKTKKIRFGWEKDVIPFVTNELQLLLNGKFEKFNRIYEKIEETYYNNMKPFVKSIVKE